MSSIFFEAVGHVFRRPVQVMCILALPMTLNILVELYDTHRYVMSGFEGSGSAALLVVVVNFMTVSLVAVAWHRVILLEEPQGIVPLLGDDLYRRYFAQWFVMGLVIFFILFMITAAIAGIVWLASIALGQTYSFNVALMGDELFGVSFYVTVTVLTTIFAYFLFRFGVVLPHLATGHEKVEMWKGWRLTQPLAWPIAGAALIAGGAQIALTWLPSDLLMRIMEEPDGYLPSSFDYLDAFVISISYSLVSLFGAAILTEIYTRVDMQTLDADQNFS
ncbi:hypothetical protein [uncultured Sulfitobacter sp.]|uniref:hypothetical protein n=1 Tax=uncultured Sulfitobacter sp. TaxID=191468 RepID=UPI00261FE980|nr:hypothetical protein [uncultured Sulfitobacter sp.]